jgi:hypothetical protein
MKKYLIVFLICFFACLAAIFFAKAVHAETIGTQFGTDQAQIMGSPYYQDLKTACASGNPLVIDKSIHVYSSMTCSAPVRVVGSPSIYLDSGVTVSFVHFKADVNAHIFTGSGTPVFLSSVLYVNPAWTGGITTGNPQFLARAIVDQAITSGTPTIISYGTLDLDTASSYSTGTSGYSAPITGFYHCDACAYLNTSATLTSFRLDFRIDNVAVTYSYDTTMSAEGNNVRCLAADFLMTAGQRLQVYLVSSGSGTMRIYSGVATVNRFSGYYIPK